MLLIGCLSFLAACAPQPNTPPNVVLISMDTTRSDHCSVYGYARDTTPNLRRIAEQGARFDLTYAPTSTTGPSHASLFTSLYPMEHGVTKNGLSLDEGLTTLAEHLQKNGYQTAAVVSSFVLDKKFGFDQGFDSYDDEFDRSTSKYRLREWEGHKIKRGFDRPGDEVTTRALQWLDEDRERDKGFFLFLHYFDAHEPYSPPEPFLSRFTPEDASRQSLDFTIGRYDGGIAYADHQIGIILKGLKKRRLHKNTIVIVIGDHGEGLLQHGYMHHGKQVYEESVRVPFLIQWPAQIPPGQTFSSPVELLDLAPTLYDLLQIDATELSLKGHNLANALRGKEAYDAPQRPIYLHRRHYDKGIFENVQGEMFGLRKGDWKYINAPDEKGQELYNLREDPDEHNNLVDAHPELTATLQQSLTAWREANTAAPSEQSPLSDEDRKALEALGYVE